MGIEFTTTLDVNIYPKILNYGPSGIGKTRMCATAKKPVIISSENKLTSISDRKIQVLKVTTIADFEEAIAEVCKKKFRKMFDWNCVDSISDIAESALSAEKPNHNDPRKAYGVIQDRMLDLLKYKIRDGPDMPWYLIAKARMIQNEDGMDMWMPKMPGRQMGPELPYIFDYVFAHRSTMEEDGDEGYTYLQTNKLDDFKWEAKDSSGKLKAREKPDLDSLLKKLKKKKKGK